MIRKITTDKDPNRNVQRSILWESCTNLRTLKQVHASMIVNGFNSNRSALRELIYASAVAIPSAIQYAHQVFAQISRPDLFMWNTMLRGCAQGPNPLETVSIYAQMEKHCLKPDDYTFPFLLKACSRLCWVSMGSVVHGKIVKHGFESNKCSRNTLIYFHANCGDINIASMLFDDHLAKKDVVAWSALTAGYARRGDLEVARRLFDDMPVKDLVSWNVMITGYVKQEEMGRARELFNVVPRKDVVTWNAMISGYVLCGEGDKALEMYEEMRSMGEKPDEVTMLCLLSACTGEGALDIGEKLHRSILEMGRGEISLLHGNALIDMYAKCGSVKKALEVFRSMKEKDISSWNSIIGGLAFNGYSEGAISLFDELRRFKFRPNEVTFVGVIVACSHAGKVDEGHRYFSLMRDVYHIKPNVRHYGCMVDLLGRAGLLNEAFEFIEAMDVKPNSIIWRTLLGACKIHNNVELGRRANEQLLSLRENESGDYVLLSNLYAATGDWHDAERVRKSMDDSGIRKDPGRSLMNESDDKRLLRFLLKSKLHSPTN